MTDPWPGPQPRPRVVFLSQYWCPEVGAPQTRLGELARYLRSLGWEVLALTAQPNYPTGAIYPGYRHWRWTSEQIDGVRVYRCPLFPSKSKRTLPRLLSYLSFAWSSALRGLMLVRHRDVLVVESPPLFAALSARFISTFRRCTYIFNVSDLWPDSALEMGWVQDGASVRLARALERWAYAGAAALTGQSPSIVAALSRRNPCKAVELLTNGVDTERFNGVADGQAFRRTLGIPDDHVIAIYAGLHGVAQGLDQILDAANRLRRESQLHFLLVGDGPEKEELQLKARAMQLGNVRFMAPVPSHEIPSLMCAADIAVVTLRFALTGAVPSKIYEGMAAGLPVVFVGAGDGVDILRDNQAGLCCPIGDGAAFENAIRRLAHDPALRRLMGQSGQAAVKRQYSRAAVAGRLSDLLVRVATGTIQGAAGGQGVR